MKVHPKCNSTRNWHMAPAVKLVPPLIINSLESYSRTFKSRTLYPAALSILSLSLSLSSPSLSFPLFLSLRYSQIQIESDWNRHLLEVKQNWCREFYEREKEERARQGYDKRQFVQVINFISNFIWKLWNSFLLWQKSRFSLWKKFIPFFLEFSSFLYIFLYREFRLNFDEISKMVIFVSFWPILNFWVSSVITWNWFKYKTKQS